MNRFEKISRKQYIEDRIKMLSADLSTEEKEKICDMEYEQIILPRRATAGSAGYDLRTPFGFTLMPGECIQIPTGIRVQMEAEYWLGIYIRSSLGFKYGVRLVNSVAVIDSDYYGSDNEGHLRVGIYNHGTKALELKAGDAFAQGILQKYNLMKDDDPVSQTRNGGFGSTGK